MNRLQISIAVVAVVALCTIDLSSTEAQLFGRRCGNSCQPTCCKTRTPLFTGRMMSRRSCCPTPAPSCCAPAVNSCCGTNSGTGMVTLTPTRDPRQPIDQSCATKYTLCMNNCSTNCSGNLTVCQQFCACQRNVCNLTAPEGTVCTPPPCFDGPNSGPPSGNGGVN